MAGIAALRDKVARGLRSFALIPEAEPADYTFADSDIEQLHRIRSDGDAPSVDQASWQGLLLGPYFTLLAGHLSIFGKQVLHQRLRAGLGDAARGACVERVRALMREPGQLDDIGRACQALRRADAEIATLLFAQELAPVPRSMRYAWLLFAGLAGAVAAVSLTPLAWLGASCWGRCWSIG